MKKPHKHSIIQVLTVFFVFLALGFTAPHKSLAATTPSLGQAATYGILANTYTNSGAATTTVNGDVGFLVAPVVPPGGTHTNYGSTPPYATAGADQATALTALNNQACTFTWPAAVELSADPLHGTVGTYTPGVYCGDAAMAVSGPITLNGSGTYIFRSVGAFDTAAGAVVTLAGGASACDIFWTSLGAATLGADTSFQGTLIDNAAVTVGANTTWTGRVLAFNGPVTTGAFSTITVPACTPPPATLHIIKQIVNDDGGTTVASSFSLHVKLSGTDVAGSPTAGTAPPGTAYSLSAGTYVVSEDANASYAQSFSGDCDSGGSVTLSSGDDKTCTITNDDIAPVIPPATINVIKTVINDNGRSLVVADFPLFVSGSPVVSGIANTFAAGTYAVSETANANYAQAFSGDCDINGNIILAPGDDLACTITNNDIADPPLSSAGSSSGSRSPVTVPTPIPVQILALTPNLTTAPTPPEPLPVMEMSIPTLPGTGIGLNLSSSPWQVLALLIAWLAIAIPLKKATSIL